MEGVGGAIGQRHSNSELALQSAGAPCGFGEDVMSQYVGYCLHHEEWELAADAIGVPVCNAIRG